MKDAQLRAPKSPSRCGSPCQNVDIGRRRERYRWSGEDLASSVTDLLDNPALNDKLPASSDAMKKAAGITVAAEAILDLI